MSSSIDEFDQKKKEFFKWLVEREVDTGNLDICRCGDMGNGVFAKEQISQGVLMKFNEKIVISANSITNNEPYKTLTKKCFLTDEEIIMLFLITEDNLENSEWRPYLNMLPRTFTKPTYSKIEHQQNFLPISVKTFLIDKKSAADASFEKLKKYFDIKSREHFDWAFNIYNTRSFVGRMYVEDNGSPTLVPFLDNFNHAKDSTVKVMFCDEIFSNHVVVTDKTILRSEQVFFHYGSSSNERLWCEFGFTLESNPYNEMEVDIADIVEAAMKYQLNLTQESLKILYDLDHTCKLRVSDHQPDNSFCLPLHILSLENDKLKNWEEDEVINVCPKLTLNVLQHLLEKIKLKEKEAPQELKWLWKDRCEIIENNMIDLSTSTPQFYHYFLYPSS